MTTLGKCAIAYLSISLFSVSRTLRKHPCSFEKRQNKKKNLDEGRIEKDAFESTKRRFLVGQETEKRRKKFFGFFQCVGKKKKEANN